MTLLLHDLRYAVRVLVKARGFTSIALVTLALAIGANTAIFSVVDALLLRPLPFPESQRLVQLLRGFPEGESTSTNVPEFVFLHDHAGAVCSGVTTYDTLGSGFNLTGDGTPERLTGSRVSQDFFSVFGVHPAAGRDFARGEDRPGAPKVTILSHGLWRRRFGGDRSLVGRSLVLNGEAYTVIGIMPASFRYPVTVDLWTPLTINPASEEKANYLEMTARLKPGVTLARAQAEMQVLARQYGAAHLGLLRERETVRVKTLQERLYGSMRPALLVLIGAVGCVLLIACVNLANLQLARATARRREVAIRAALGAQPGRILAQLLTESVLLAFAGGGLGLFLGWASLKPLVALAPADQLAQITGTALPRIGIDGTVLAFTFGISLLAGILFGLAPALQAVRFNLHEPLQEGTMRSTGGARGVLVRRLLVVGEVSLALLLITCAALLLRSFSGLTHTHPGFRPEGVLTMKLSLPEARYAKPEQLEQLSRRIAERLQALPGVRAAAIATSLPLELGPDMPIAIEGKWRGGASKEGLGDAQYRGVTAGYFATLGIPLSRGRLLTERDTGASEPVAVVNEAALREIWKGENPVGSRILIGLPEVPDLADKSARRIVGVVKDVRESGLDTAAPPIVYVPVGQISPPLAALFVRLLPLSVVVETQGEPYALTRAVEREIWAVDPLQPVSQVITMEAIVTRSIGSFRFNLLLLGGLAAIALGLAAVGIYGVLAYLVSQRTREIGVRMALGATGWHVLRMVVGQGFAAVGAGVALGLGLALAAGRLLRSLLVGVSVQDPLTFLVAPLVLATVALIASSIPARRASRLDPVLALRRD